MIIAVISDTHDQADKICRAVQLINEEGAELVVHCGDWVSPFILGFFRELEAPMRGGFGNNDGDKFRHAMNTQKWGFDLTYEARFLRLQVGGRSIAVFHGDYPELVDGLVKCGEYDAVFHGHTHVPVNELVGNTLSLNPGSFMDKTSDTVKGASFAFYDTADNSARHIDL